MKHSKCITNIITVTVHLHPEEIRLILGKRYSEIKEKKKLNILSTYITKRFSTLNTSENRPNFGVYNKTRMG